MPRLKDYPPLMTNLLKERIGEGGRWNWKTNLGDALGLVLPQTQRESLTTGLLNVGMAGFPNAKPIWLDEFLEKGGKINKDGTITLFHATTKDKAEAIVKEGYLKSPKGTPDTYGVHFSTHPEVAMDYGDGTVVTLKAKVSDLSLQDIFPSGRMDFMAKTKKNIYKPIWIGFKE